MLARAFISVFSFVFRVYVMFGLLVFGCQYQCNRLPGKNCIRNDLLCFERDVMPWLHVKSNDFEIILNLFQCIISHVTTSETKIKLFQPLKES